MKFSFLVAKILGGYPGTQQIKVPPKWLDVFPLSFLPAYFTGCVLFVLLSGCTGVNNVPGTPTVYEDVSSPGLIRGTGIESQDIQSMVDKMVRHMLANPVLGNAGKPPRVIVNAAYFENQSSQRLNKNILIDQLAAQLQMAANGRILFIDRDNADMVAKERDLKREGITDVGTTGLTRAVAGADYRLNGRITSLDSRTSTGVMERYMNIVFRMTDLENGLVVWTNQYSFKKAGQDDVIYR